MLRYYLKLLLRLCAISWQRIRAFNFEFLMMLVHLLFNFSFILIFWGAFLRHITVLGDWTFAELALFSGVTFLGESISGVFWGFRDLPARIVNGELDKFMVRPVNLLFLVLFEQVSIVYFIEQFVASLILLWIIVTRYSLALQVGNVLWGFLILLLGVLIYNFLYGAITFLAFWVGKVGVFRSILFGLSESKNYPLSIYPGGVRFFLTFIIPVALISYYPAAIILGKVQVSAGLLLQVGILLLLMTFFFRYIWGQGLKRYEANGG